MSTIGDFCGGPAIRRESSRRHIGIEVEYEGYNSSRAGVIADPQMRWNVVEDGSLRNGGIEFVSIPLPYHRAYAAFRWLNDQANRCDWESTVRTGIHVHVNVRDMEVDELKGVIAAYAAFEPLLFELCGREREENIYCVPWYRAPDQARMVPHLSPLMSDVQRTSGVNFVKYSAMYLEPIWRFGTIEFRQAPTWLDSASMKRWILALVRMVEWGRGKTPEQVHDECQHDPNVLVQQVFGRTMASVRDAESLMDEVDSLGTVEQMFSCTYKNSDWTWKIGPGATEGIGYHRSASRMRVEDIEPIEPDYYDDDDDYEEDY